MVTERGLQVLRVIVQDYVAHREPVGSKSIVERHPFGVSAATIRNEMAQLEEEELIVAPHTSSGRIPTDKGYRLFVDRLAALRPLTAAQRQAIQTFLGESPDLEEVLAKTVRLLSQLTNSVAVVQYPSFEAARVRHIELVVLAPRRLLSVLITDAGHVDQRVLETPADVDETLLGEIRAKLNTAMMGLRLQSAAESLRTAAEQFSPERREVLAPILQTLQEQVGVSRQERLVMAGTANLVRTEEDFSGSIYTVLEAIEEQVELLRLFAEMTPDPRGVSVRIGRENSPSLHETSVLTSGYVTAGGQLSRLGVLGPLRMDYSGNIAAVRAVARYLSRLLGEE
ncbi:heat-inducible transcriptional repressor HrcA [Rathayibacter toxicus]|uniref:Heat-inducible transcription repressor HrcA n=1 Tax=Rathayibacter toxicus TaxID=145458 RepID=A0A0C5BE19_9MICO|nr:heat-inducible transcriptional repressor HrcA [Rathayibacter toxicus]AJM77501.1 HrcA family transcriptional regulator [Rathayibacter toxicus]ALS56588.1 HrcA family transcriptional regulator [Rathayibacter toxicus]KKM44680.1 HrcA family transcriptional regulator [Rathayibacter toxicus]PPG21587.1 heat-inducible transcriptional repressor HrcA [Rathayibacter toxicus]PPG46549.1 heat-inducible transcriptional repressor HrcA [Rathayibacter toxicus]